MVTKCNGQISTNSYNGVSKYMKVHHTYTIKELLRTLNKRWLGLYFGETTLIQSSSDMASSDTLFMVISHIAKAAVSYEYVIFLSLERLSSVTPGNVI